MQPRLLDLMLNPAMLMVNQVYAGNAGGRIWTGAVGREVRCHDEPWAMYVRNSVHTALSYHSNRTTDSVRTQVWAKPLPNKTVAVVMLNRDGVALW